MTNKIPLTPEGRPQSYRQCQLLLPLLEVLGGQDGVLKGAQACDAVADRVGVDPQDREREVRYVSGTFNKFDRDVRWAKQRAVLKGLIETPQPGHWRITGKGRKALREALPGVVITLYETDSGVALYGSCEDAVGYIEPQSVQLILTSPPYQLVGRTKDYQQQMAEADYVAWMASLAKQWRPLLTGDGSLVLNLGDAWLPGRPEMSLYAERLLLKLVDECGYRLAQRFEWLSRSRLPSPAEWVCVRRVRVKPALERLYWLTPHEHPYADNRAVLKPYSASMLRRIASGGERAARRPSGYAMQHGAFSASNGGAIPSNLLDISHSDSNNEYVRACRAANLPVHPARFPQKLAEFFVSMLSREQDLVYDPFGGSGTTAAAAEKLGRRWITSERALDYAQGSRLRFRQAA